jgi:hypothetical protein
MAGEVAQVVEHLHSNNEALSSNSSIAKKQQISWGILSSFSSTLPNSFLVS